MIAHIPHAPEAVRDLEEWPGADALKAKIERAGEMREEYTLVLKKKKDKPVTATSSTAPRLSMALATRRCWTGSSSSTSRPMVP